MCCLINRLRFDMSEGRPKTYQPMTLVQLAAFMEIADDR
jgi:hypothetical protein